MSQAATNSGSGTPDTPLLAEFPPLFRNRNFLLIWVGHIVSALGDRVQFMVALYILARQILGIKEPGTQQAAQLTIAMLMPFVLLGPVAGLLADRLPRRKVMVVADISRALIIVAVRTVFLGYHERMSVGWLLVLLFGSEFLMSVFAAMFSPARTALLPNLVHPDQLLRANSLTTAAGTIASLLGFAVGSTLIAVQTRAPAGTDVVFGPKAPSPTLAMYAGAVTFVLSAACLLGMRISKAAATGISANERKASNAFRELWEGFRYMLQHKRTLQIIGLMLLFWSCGTVIMNGLLGIVTTHYRLDMTWYGYFLSLLGVGMILGAASCSLARRGIAKEVGIAWAMVGVGVSLFLFSITKRPWAGLLMLMGGSFMGAVLLVSLDTLLQRIVPNYVRGRVMGVKDLVSTAGLVSAAVPLAINPYIDEEIRYVLMAMSGVVLVTGVLLVRFYYRRQTLPLPVAIARRVASAYLGFWHRFERGNACRIPTTGPVIFVANHTSAIDPLILQAASRRRVIRFMMAKEYYEKKPLHYYYKSLGIIPVNRTGNDTASIRAALRALKDGECIGMFPEGKISEDGRMNEGRQGVALLALTSGATVVPAYVRGTNTYRSMVGDFVDRGRITFYFGRPLRFDDLAGKERDPEAREEATRRIMGEIIRLRDKYETNPERRVSAPEWAEGKRPATKDKE